MKKEYKDLELETVRFEAEDVITASGDECPKDAPGLCSCDNVKVVDPGPGDTCPAFCNNKK